MEIEITEFFNAIEPSCYSASRAELGENVVKITWQNAKAKAKEKRLLKNRDELQAFVDFCSEFGAWSREEMAEWTFNDANALFIQFVSGDMREAGLHADMTAEEWQAYESEAQAGNVSGRIFGGPLSTNGKIYYSLW